jgi:hypothetical protein
MFAPEHHPERFLQFSVGIAPSGYFPTISPGALLFASERVHLLSIAFAKGQQG